MAERKGWDASTRDGARQERGSGTTKPSHSLVVYDAEGRYTQLGAAWPTRDGAGLRLKLKPGVALVEPTGGRIVLLPDRQ